MKKKAPVQIYITLLLLLPQLLLAQVDVIKQLDFVSISYTSGEILIDGEIDDWVDRDKLTFYIDNGHFHENDSLFNSVDSIEVSMAWDEYFLYLLLKNYDRNLVKIEDSTGNINLWHNDGLELYLDPKFDSEDRMKLDDFNCVVDFSGEYVFFTPTKRTLEDDFFNVPKEGNAKDIYFETATKYVGTVNDNTDIDSGYFIEVKLPWAALGILPQSGDSLRLEVCVNDLDSLCSKDDFVFDSIQPPHFYFSSWTGSKNWGIPKDWKKVKLVGNPSFLSKWSKKYFGQLLAIFIAILMGMGIVIFLVFKRNNQLKNIHRKSAIKNQELIQLLEDKKSIANTQSDNSGSTPKNLALFEKAKNILDEKLDENIRPADLAKKLNMSLRQFQRACKEQLDITPNAFITLYKIEKAAILLQHEDMNITEVAFAIGFSDPNYFSKVFKKYFNQSPKAYLENIQQTATASNF